MDRSLTEAEWTVLLALILSHSKELEPALSRSSAHLIESLSQMSSLEKIAQTHLTPPSPLPPTPSAIPTVKLSAPMPRPGANRDENVKTAVRYQTDRQEYEAALKQNELVSALLQYQRRRGGKAKSLEPEFEPIRIPVLRTKTGGNYGKE